MKWPFFAVWPLGHVQQIKANEVSLCIGFYRLDDSLWGASGIIEWSMRTEMLLHLFQR